MQISIRLTFDLQYIHKQQTTQCNEQHLILVNKRVFLSYIARNKQLRTFSYDRRQNFFHIE